MNAEAHSKNQTIKRGFRPGFTVVELLVVIVVIAVLATIAIIAYNGAQERARAAAVASALNQAAKKMKLHEAGNDTYPATLADAGVENSSDISYQYTVNNTATPKTYCITATYGSVSSMVTQSGAPTSGGCSGHVWEGSGPVDDGLILHLDAGNSDSYAGTGTTWFDVSESNNNGTLEGVGYTSSDGGAMTFDGVNDRVTTNSSLSPTAITISVWVYRTSSVSNQGIVRKNSAYALSLYSNIVQFAPGNDWRFYNTGSSIPLNTWRHFVLTYDNSSMRLYRDGVQVWTQALAGTLPANANPTRIGHDDNGWWWGGRISGVYIYSRALSATEVQQNFDLLKSRYGL